jgi:5-methylcytosine-specific restriction endonuclease McrA
VKHRSEIRRRSWMRRGTPLPRENRARKAKRKAEYQAFLRSPEWKAIRKGALERAGYRCEELIPNPLARRERGVSLMRCTATRRLTVHHMTYARFGGRELPRDLKTLCKEHHDARHASQPWKKIA